MRRRFFVLMALFFLVALGWGSKAAANLQLSPQLGYGTASYREVMGNKDLFPGAKELSTRLVLNYVYDDLLFTGEYQKTNGLGDARTGRDLVQFSANYLVFEEDILRVYGGLGYQFLKARFNHSQLEGEANYAGSNFIGQAVLAIDIIDELQASLTINGTPWLNWTLNEAAAPRGSSFQYHLHLAYDFKEEYGLHFGLLGGNYKIPSSKDHGTTTASFSGVNLGLIWRF